MSTWAFAESYSDIISFFLYSLFNSALIYAHHLNQDLASTLGMYINADTPHVAVIQHILWRKSLSGLWMESNHCCNQWILLTV